MKLRVAKKILWRWSAENTPARRPLPGNVPWRWATWVAAHRRVLRVRPAVVLVVRA